MPKFAVIDVETSGLFDFSRPADAPGQPRLAHLALIFVDEDLNVESEESLMVKPEGWTMPADAAAIHGLTDELLQAKGLPVAQVLEVYSQAIKEGRVIVGFNVQFDCKMMRGELRRAGMPDLFEATPNICVMRPLTGVCKIEKKTGNGYKFPKLSEALAHFKILQEGAHTAMGDAQAALRLMRKCREIGVLPEAEVHYAQPGTKAGAARGLPVPEEAAAPKRKAKPAPSGNIADEEIPV